MIEGRFYKCLKGIQEYKTNRDYFIKGKIYKCYDEVSLIDEEGDTHFVPTSIAETHFMILNSNKRKGHEHKERKTV